MTEGETQKPEGKLLHEAMQREGLSFRAIAAQIGMSDARVRNIINGYQAVGRGQRIDITGPEDTVAKIAAVVQVTPEQLEAAGRHDAARALRRRLPGGEMPDWARMNLDDASWRHVVATHEEIREWAEDPENFLPPESILEYFKTDSLLAEIEGRMAQAERVLNPYFWQQGFDSDVYNRGGSSPDESEGVDRGTSAEKSDGGASVTRLTPRPDSSDLDETLDPAADDVRPDDDEEPGGSDDHV